MKVPVLDLKAEYADLRDEILQALDKLCQSSAFVEGPEVAAFEREFADFFGTNIAWRWRAAPPRCIWGCWRWASSPAAK